MFHFLFISFLLFSFWRERGVFFLLEFYIFVVVVVVVGGGGGGVRN